MLDAGQQDGEPGAVNFEQVRVDWAPFLNSKWTDAADTQVPLAELQRLRNDSRPYRRASRYTDRCSG